MKKFIVAAVFLALALAAAVGVFFLRDTMVRLPWAKAEAFDFPEAAFARDDGSFVLFDRHGTRMLSVDKDANLLWMHGSGAIYGTFLSADMDSSGNLFLIDRQFDSNTATRIERVMRVSADGSPGGILFQGRMPGKAGFVPGSLRVAGDSLWYLCAGEDGLAAVIKLNIKDTGKETVVKTEWELARASLAVAGPDGALVVNSGGGLVRYVRDRFEALAELTGPLPYPVDIRYDKDGNLLVADAAGGVISRVSADGTASVLVRQKDSAVRGIQNPDLSPAPLDYFLNLAAVSAIPSRFSAGSRIDAFSLLKDGFVSVDKMNSKVVFFDAKGSAKRALSGAALPVALMRNCLAAWILAGVCLLFSALFLIALSVAVVTGVPRGFAMLFAAFPGAFLVFVVVVIIFVHASFASVAASDALSLGAMRGMAAAGALSFDAEKLSALEPVSGQSDPRLAEFLVRTAELRKAAGTEHVGNVALYKLGPNGLTAVCDSAGLYPAGYPQRFVSDAYFKAMLIGTSYSAAETGPIGRWRIAAAPVKSRSGEVIGVLEYSTAAPLVPLRFIVTAAIEGNVKYLLLVILGLAFSSIGSLLTVALRTERYLPAPVAAAPDVFSGMKTDDEYSSDDSFHRESHVPEMRGGSAERFEPDFDDSGIQDGSLPDDIAMEDRMHGETGSFDEAFGIPELDDASVDFDLYAIPELPAAFDMKPVEEEKPAAAPAAKERSPNAGPSLGGSPGASVKIAPFEIPSVKHQKLHREAIAALKDGRVDEAVAVL